MPAFATDDDGNGYLEGDLHLRTGKKIYVGEDEFEGGGGGSSEWGGITGDIEDQTDLVALLATKADGTAGVKVYRGLYTKEGSNDPELVEIENTVGGTVTWDAGGFFVFSGFLITNSFFAQNAPFKNSNDEVGVVYITTSPGADGGFEYFKRVYFSAMDAGLSNIDATGVPIEILVYP